jgi:O-methyltransferase
VRRGPGSLYRRWMSIQFLATRDRRDVIGFLRDRAVRLGPLGKLDLLRRFTAVTNQVRGYHTLGEMLAVSRAILARERPVVLEAGCGHGSSTAKLSLAVRAAGGRLIVCDSFRGLPANREEHRHVDGRSIQFRAGAFRATLPQVQRAVARLGAPEVVSFHKGWFADTLPGLATPPLDVVVLDVDLVESTRVCLRELVPRLAPGGILFTLDGQLRATHELLASDAFWSDEVGVPPPRIEGLGEAKLLVIRN